jgi:hypothetical protein
MNLANQSTAMVPEERIEMLGRALIIAGRPMDVQQAEVYGRIQRILLQTEGHAEYYQKKIKEIEKKSEEKIGPEMVADGLPVTPSEITGYFDILEHLPSSEQLEC